MPFRLLPRHAVDVSVAPCTQLRNSRRGSRRRGMTLVEVLLAMVILATGAMVLMTAVSRCLAVIRIARNYHTARHVFDLGELEYPIAMKEDKLLNITLDPVSPDENHKDFTFSRTSEKEEKHKGMVIIKTRVDWSDRGNHVGEEVVSYLYNTNDTGMFP